MISGMPEHEELASQLWLFLDRMLGDLSRDNRDEALSKQIAFIERLRPALLAMARTAFAHTAEFAANYEQALRERPKDEPKN